MKMIKKQNKNNNKKNKAKIDLFTTRLAELFVRQVMDKDIKDDQNSNDK